MNKYFTGIGSRETPDLVCELMTKVARLLAEKGYTLRSGGAEGADKAFESGSKDREIFLPWKGFNGNPSKFCKPSDKAKELASMIHPVWDKLTHGAKLLHARNVHQVLGDTLNKPSDFIICWTMGGGQRGGTATAMKVAELHGIPIYNLYDEEFALIEPESLVELILGEENDS